MTRIPLADLLAPVEELCRQAGAVIMAVYATDFDHQVKGDNSPVTEADRRAEALILPGLAALTPDIPVVAEEEAAAGRIPQVAGRFWLVDPLDGTKEFLKRNGEFTVNIGLIDNGVPVLGAVYAPAQGILWSGAGPGTATRVDGDGRRAIACRTPPAQGAVVIASRSHRNPEQMAAWLAQLEAPVTADAGSSLKFCRVAEGSADFYPRLGPTCEWDTAAAHAVVLAAGGEVVLLDDPATPLPYGKTPDFRNPNFLARKRPD